MRRISNAPTGEISWSPDAKSLDRIIAATAAKATVDRECLAAGLLDAWFKWLRHSPLDDKGAAGRRARLFQRVVFDAKKFRKRLLDPTGDQYVLRATQASKTFLAELDRVIETAEFNCRVNEPMRGGSGKQRPVTRLMRAPTEWFVAEVLAPVFEDS